MASPILLTGAGNVTVDSSASATSRSPAKPSNTADLDLLIAFVYFRNAGAGTTSAPSGWTSFSGNSLDNGLMEVFYKSIPLASAEVATTYTFSTSNGASRCGVAIVRCTGADLSNPEDVFGSAGITAVASSITTLENDALLVAYHTDNITGTTPVTINPPTGMTEVFEIDVSASSSTSLQASQEARPTAGATGTRTFTFSTTPGSQRAYMFSIASASNSYSATIDDAVGITDSTTINTVRGISDNIGITDAALGVIGTLYLKSQQDTVNITDGTADTVRYAIGTDDLHITDEIAWEIFEVVNFTATIDDTVGITDLYAPQQIDIQETIDDAVGVTDTVLRAANYDVVIDDVVGITDGFPVLTTNVQGYDSIQVTDTASGIFTIAPVTLNDTIGITDSLIVGFSGTLQITDNVAITDVAVVVRTPTVSDAVGITSSHVIARTSELTDGITIFDTVTVQRSLSRTIDDAVGTSDATSVEIAGAANTIVNDTIGITDNIAIAFGNTVPVSDNIGITDDAAVNRTVYKSDTIGITDTVSVGMTRIIDDTIAIVDQANISYPRTVDDAVGITDTTVTAQSFVRTINDAVGITDITLGGTAFFATIDDAIGIVDGMVVNAPIRITIDDVITIADSAIAAESFNVSLDDSVSITDAAMTSSGIVQVIDDPIGITDSSTTSNATDFVVTLNDTVGVTDSISTSFSLVKIISDNVGVTDTHSKQRGLCLNDVVNLVDTAGINRAAYLYDQVTIYDVVATIYSFNFIISDTILITDSATPGNGFQLTLNDTVAITDYWNGFQGKVFTQPTDLITITDTVTYSYIVAPGAPVQGPTRTVYPTANTSAGFLGLRTRVVYPGGSHG